MSAHTQFFRVREAFERFLREQGFGVLLLRRQRNVPCVCEGPSTTCPYCLGTGSVLAIERQLAVERLATGTSFFTTRATTLTDVGFLSAEGRFFYLPATSAPKAKDLIVVPHRLDPAGRPVPPLSWYEIQHSEPRRVFGHVLLWIAACQQDAVAAYARSIALVRGREGELRYLAVYPVRPDGKER